MNRRFFTAIVFAFAAIMVSAIAAQQPAQSASGWQLPPDADTTKNPLPVDAKLIATGKIDFQGKLPEVPRRDRPRRWSRCGSGCG